MKFDSKKNLSNITIDDIIEKIKSSEETLFNKIIISKDSQIKRTNFFFLNYTSQFLNRTSKKLNFPLFGDIADDFKSLESLKDSNGKTVFDSKSILNSLSSNHNIYPESDELGSEHDFDFPIKVEEDKASSTQPFYYIKERTFLYDCEGCDTNKYVKCADAECNGRHTWKCTNCSAKGTLVCDGCAGNKTVTCSKCSGSKKIKCKNCGGDGKVVDKLDTLSAVSSSKRSTRIVKKNCKQCSGKGQVNCTECNNGKVSCRKCDAQGKLVCNVCNGNRDVTCGQCYGDKERYGLIDCPTCVAMGRMGKISYVETEVLEKNLRRIFYENNELSNIDEEMVHKFTDESAPQELIMNNVNNSQFKKYDSVVEGFINQIQTEMNFKLEGYKNRVTREELFFQVIPCVQTQYKNILTNTYHDITILNFFDSPEIISENEINSGKSSFKDVSKKTGNFFGKLFKTKKFKEKEDFKKEIKLLIRLSRADGKIEEEEKIFLSNKISSLDSFTSTEKIDLFNFMDTASLPELKNEDVVFYDKQKFTQVLKDLEKIASEDGSIADSESKLLNQIKTLGS